MSEPSAPRPAATILLLRDLDPHEPGFEVFMIERSAQSKFMAGAYVFPGGRVEAGDAAHAGSTEQAAEQLFGGRLTGSAALAHLGAARRELQEEALVTLPPDTPIVPFAHWITPPVESRRFDTWFFVTVLPPGLKPGHDDHEAVDSRWVDPREALHGDEGLPTLPLPPPTYHSLWDLARFAHAADVVSDARGRRIPACEPTLEFVDGRPAIILPGDPMHSAGEPMQGPTRLVLGRGDAWWGVAEARWGRPKP